jgi:lysophospholipase L1-like esterase
MLSERMDEAEKNTSLSILCGYPDNVYCIGDSLTAGYVKIANSAYLSHYSYPYFLGKLMNTNVVAYAQAGDTASLAWERWQTEIGNITDSLVIVWLGTNPALTDTVDTDCVGDDPAEYADTHTGNYGKIIKTLTDNGNKVVLAHIFISHNPTIVATANITINSLGDRFDCKVIELSSGDIEELNNEKYHTAEDGTYDVTHLSCMGYSFVANMFFGKMNRLAMDDPQWFCIRKNKA